MIQVHTQLHIARAWIESFRRKRPLFACVLGFTATGLIPGISAAGATPADRKHTAIADAEFLYHGPRVQPTYPLPPLHAGASPVLISRAVLASQTIPIHLFNAGLPHAPTVPCIDLGGRPARCVSQGQAMSLEVVQHLFYQGLDWGDRLAQTAESGYLIIGECVVGGTTTALAVLTGLGWNAAGKVNSSHPTCNHQQKWEIVAAGLQQLQQQISQSIAEIDPFQVVAAVGDPMQVVVAGMAIAASRTCGVLLAGGTQMLAVYALAQASARFHQLTWHSNAVVVGTTRWVANDPTGDTVGLADDIQAPLLASQLTFANSQHQQLRAYEHGYVKEGVGAGGCAIAAHLHQNWSLERLLQEIDALATCHDQIQRKEFYQLI
jgi:uncharacterized protein (TIGR00303 family)